MLTLPRQKRTEPLVDIWYQHRRETVFLCRGVEMTQKRFCDHTRRKFFTTAQKKITLQFRSPAKSNVGIIQKTHTTDISGTQKQNEQRQHHAVLRRHVVEGECAALNGGASYTYPSYTYTHAPNNTWHIRLRDVPQLLYGSISPQRELL